MNSVPMLNDTAGPVETPDTAARSSLLTWMSTGALILIYAGLWLHLTPYGGLGHDAQAYALEALAKLNPVPFAQELFVLYRSQEEFTLFPHVYAALIDLFGLESAASITVFLCHLLWYSVAFLLLKRLLGTTTAFLSLGLLITLSGTYGGFRVFHMAEPFLTARLPGEVISLGAIWLYLSNRKLIATIATIAAIAIHPLIAFPVAALLVCLEIGRRGPWYAVPALLILGVLAAIAGSFLLADGDPFMSGRWLAMTQLRSGFLFVHFWRSIDWNDTLLNLLTLAIGAAALSAAMPRRVAQTVLGVALAGLVLAAISSLWLSLEVLIQGQPWRWVWISRFFAIALLPAIVLSMWTQGRTGRGSALLLISAWIFIAPVSAQSPMMLMLGTLLSGAALAIWLTRQHLADFERIIAIGSSLVCGAVMLSSMATMSVASALMSSGTESAVSVSSWMTGILRMLTPAVGVAVGACAIARMNRYPWRIAVLAITGVVLVGTGVPTAFAQWTSKAYTGQPHTEFADWRQRIPVESEVLWYDNLRETWFLLERRAYLTRSQSGGVVFSEALADEVVRRALVLEPYIDPNFWIITGPSMKAEPNPLSAEIMRSICRDHELGYVVSEDDIGSAVASKQWPEAGEYIYLYDCRDYRGESSG